MAAYRLMVEIPGDEEGRVIQSPWFSSVAQSVDVFREAMDQLEERGFYDPDDPPTPAITFIPLAIEEDTGQRPLTDIEQAAMDAAFEQVVPWINFSTRAERS
jgi:hypothetical protein